MKATFTAFNAVKVAFTAVRPWPLSMHMGVAAGTIAGAVLGGGVFAALL
ncbi:hypothetical protein [Prauserella flavalba]|nr:hypothetical protein [Prauserella flavalba]